MKPSGHVDSATSVNGLDRFVLAALGVGIPLSGYIYYDMRPAELEFAPVIRGVVIAVLLFCIVALCATRFQLSVPVWVLALLAPIIYMGGVSAIMNSVATYISPLARWLLYVCGAYYVYSLRRPIDGVRVYAVFSSVTYIVSIASDVAFGRMLYINQASRIGAGVGSPLGLACALFITIMALTYLYYEYGRWRYLLLAGLLFVGLVLTASRSIAVGLVIVAPAYVISQYRGAVRRVLVAAIVGMVTAMVGWVIIRWSDLGSRLAVLGIEGDSSASLRAAILGIVQENFRGVEQIVGLGLGGFPNWFRIERGLENVAPHFEAVWIYVEGGVVGVMFYLGSVAFIVRSLVRRWRNNVIEWHLMAFGMICIFAQQTVYQFANPGYFYQAMLPVYFGIGAALGSRRHSNVLWPEDAGTRSRTVALGEKKGGGVD